MEKLVIKNNSTNGIFPLKNRNGIESLLTQIHSGNKIIVTLYVNNLVGSNVKLRIYNSFSEDIPYRLVKEITLSSNGFEDFTLMNFHQFVKFELEANGNAECSVGVSTKDDSRSGNNSNVEILDELNRLVPEFYDDVEVLAETVGKQPTLIEFRKEGQAIRTIQITYVNEIFKRVQSL